MTMILRLLRGQVPDGQEAPLLGRLRTIVQHGGPPPGFVSASFGFRRDGDELAFLALSTWESIEAITSATGGAPNLPIVRDTSIVPQVSIDLYEVAAETAPTGPTGGAALGLVWGRVVRNAEGVAHEMIRAIAPEVTVAGVTALHVGRRVHEGDTEVLVVATWRDRLALHEFAKARTSGTLDPAFLRLLTEWRFETYDSLDPAALLVPPRGPAVLLADDGGRYVDASPGIEALIGVPAEMILRQTIVDLTPPELRGDVPDAWQSFSVNGRASGEWTLLRPDGRRVPVAFRAEANCPAPGIHASVLTRLDDANVDRRPVAEIVAELFPRPALTPA
jgi:PAS domain-containing protein